MPVMKTKNGKLTSSINPSNYRHWYTLKACRCQAQNGQLAYMFYPRKEQAVKIAMIEKRVNIIKLLRNGQSYSRSHPLSDKPTWQSMDMSAGYINENNETAKGHMSYMIVCLSAPTIDGAITEIAGTLSDLYRKGPSAIHVAARRYILARKQKFVGIGRNV